MILAVGPAVGRPRVIVALSVVMVAVLAGPASPAYADPTATGSIAVGLSPSYVAVSPDGSKAYVTNAGAGTVSVIDTATDAVARTMTVGGTPAGVAFSPNGQKAYVAVGLEQSSIAQDYVAVLNARTDQVTGNIPIAIGGGPSSLPSSVVFSVDGKTAYVAQNRRTTITVIDAQTDTKKKDVDLGMFQVPVALAVSPDGQRLYAPRATSPGKVSVFALPTLSNLTSFTADINAPTDVAVSPDSSRLFVGSQSQGIDVLDTVTGFVVNRLRPSAPSLGLALSADGSRLLSATGGSNTLDVFDSATSALVAGPIALGRSGFKVAATPDGTRAYVTSPDTNSVTVVAFRPSPPQSVSGVPGDASATVSWTPPSFTGLPIGDYTVTASPGAGTCSTTTTSCTVPGLTNGTAYTFTVIATNPVGTSVPSAPTDPVTPRPGPPADSASLTVRAKAVAKRTKLRVTVKPRPPTTQQFRFRLERKKRATWVAKKSFTTRGAEHSRVIDPPRGRYRVTLPASTIYPAATSKAVRLRR